MPVSMCFERRRLISLDTTFMILATSCSFGLTYTPCSTVFDGDDDDDEEPVVQAEPTDEQEVRTAVERNKGPFEPRKIGRGDDT